MQAPLAPGPGTGPARRLTGVLALTETVSWGVLFYAFAGLILPMEAALGTGRAELLTAAALATLGRAGAAPLVGAIVDRWGVRWVMTIGSFAAVGTVLAWSAVRDVDDLRLVMFATGLVGAMVLYEPAFAAITRASVGRARERAILLVTIAGGLASTVVLPTTAALEGWLGWRGALQALAVALVVLTVLPNLTLLRDPPRAPVPAPVTGPSGPPAVTGSPPTRRWLTATLRDLRPVAAMLLLGGLPFGTLALHLPAVLEERGGGRLAAAALAGAIGPLSVTGRILLTWALRRVSLPGAMTLVFLLQTVGLVALLVPGTAATIVFVLLFGIGYGTLTIASPLLVAERVGTDRFGRASGVLHAVGALVGAGAPVLAGLVRDTSGSYAPVLAGLAVLAAAAAVSARRLRPARTDGPPPTAPASAVT